MPRNTISSGRLPRLDKKVLFVALALFIFLIVAPFTFSDSVSAAAHTKLTDGTAASASSSDSGWVVFDYDSTQLPLASPSPNLSAEFFGTNEFKNDDSGFETQIEDLLYEAGVKGYRITLYTHIFAKPNSSAPYWNWDWFDNYPDGERISRAISAGQMVNIVVHSTPGWANKSLPDEYLPMAFVSNEEVTLNDTTPAKLSHNFIMGEVNEQYLAESVIGSAGNTPYKWIENEIVGVGTGAAYQELSLKNSPLILSTVKIFVNGEEWSEVDYFSSSSNKSFVIFPNTGKIRFGAGANAPQVGAAITAQYSYYTSPYREYGGSSYNTSDTLDYRIDYKNGTIVRTDNSTIPSGETVRVSYYYLDTSWWQNFWKELTAHYAGKVKYFEVWNEQNLPLFFHGTTEQYSELLRTAYIGAKQGNSNSQILIGGLAAYPQTLSKLYSLGAKDYFDVLAWHPYGWQNKPDNPNSELNTTNETYYSVANNNGDDSKMVFMNETGFGSMTWEEQGYSLGRMYLKLARDKRAANVSWWSVVDTYPIGVNESDLYSGGHLGLMALDVSGKLVLKPTYYTYKNLATNKGIIIDTAKYDESGNNTQWSNEINQVLFSSLNDDISEVKLFTSQNNTTDWKEVTATLSSYKNSRGTYDYVLSFPQVSARFVQLQFVKKSGVKGFAIDEVLVFNTANSNVAYNRLYAVAGFRKDSTPLPSTNPTTPQTPSTPTNTPSSSTGSSSGGGGGGGGLIVQRISIECSSDSDCTDGNVCSPGVCTFPKTAESKCVYSVLPSCTSDSNILDSNFSDTNSLDNNTVVDTNISAQQSGSNYIAGSSRSSRLSVVIPSTVVTGEKFVVKVVDDKGEPVSGAIVKYGNASFASDSLGTVEFVAKKDSLFIFAANGDLEASSGLMVADGPYEKNQLTLFVILLIAVIIGGLFYQTRPLFD